MSREGLISKEIQRLQQELCSARMSNPWWDRAIQETGRMGIERITAAPKAHGRQGVLLVGGGGARLSPITQNLNKHLLPVGAQPMCFYPLANLITAGVTNLWVSTSKRDLPAFQAILGAGEQFGISINYHIQVEPRGVASAIASCFEFLEDRAAMVALGDGIFVGDTFADFVKSISFNSGACMPMFEIEGAQRYECVEFSSQGKAVDFHEKPETPPSSTVSGGIYIFDSRARDFAKKAPLSPRGEYDVNAINRGFRDKGDIHLVPLPKNIRYVDAGQFETLADLAQHFDQLTPQQCLATYSPHIAAYRRGNINIRSLLEYCQSRAATSGYFSHTMSYLRDWNENS